MADLNVQPKRKQSILPWILLFLGILALLFFLMRGCKNTDKSTVTDNDSISAATKPVVDNWSDVDFNAPVAAYGEITDSNINVRGNDNYSIYGLGENILFDEGKSSIRSDAEQNLKQVAASIQQRYKDGNVRVYGYTDAKGSAGYNKELAGQRAQAVSNWLSANGGVSKDNISLEPVGEDRPVATNATSQGRQQNRRVEIVVKKAR